LVDYRLCTVRGDYCFANKAERLSFLEHTTG